MRTLILVIAECAFAVWGCTAIANDLPLTRVAAVSLPGNPTRFDYESIDPSKRLLFVAHMGDSAIVVMDLTTNRVAGVIPGIDDVHGVLAIPQRNVVYASATGTNEVVAIDEKRRLVVAPVNICDRPARRADRPRSLRSCRAQRGRRSANPPSLHSAGKCRRPSYTGRCRGTITTVLRSAMRKF